MPVVISVKAEFEALAATLNQAAKSQLPFAVSRALNDAAMAAAKGMNADATKIFNKATPFTRNAVVAPGSLSARKDRLLAVVTVRPIQAKYLLHEQEGGIRTPAENTRKPNAKALVVPGKGLKLNTYGNIPNGTVAKLMATLKTATNQAIADRHAAKRQAGIRAKAVAQRDRGIFYVGPAGHANLPGGIYQRLPGHRITKLISFTPTERYRPKYDFGGRTIRIAHATFARQINARLTEALLTARP